MLGESRYLVFPSLDEADSYAQSMILRNPTVECAIFDHEHKPIKVVRPAWTSDEPQQPVSPLDGVNLGNVGSGSLNSLFAARPDGRFSLGDYRLFAVIRGSLTVQWRCCLRVGADVHGSSNP